MASGHRMPGRPDRRRWAPALLAALWAWHLHVVARHAVDVPYWDDWEALHPAALPSGPKPQWLLARHNDNVKVPTKAEIWTLYRLTGWDLRVQQIVNFILFGALVALAGLTVRRLSPDLDAAVVAAFLAFPLSPLLFENHSWAMQSCFHFQLLFFLAAALALFTESLGWGRLGLGLALAWLSLNSYASGAAACGVLLACYAGFRTARALRLPGRARREELLRAAAGAAGLGLALVLWTVGYAKPPESPPPTWPTRWVFWRFVANLAGLGFGFDEASFPLGLACLAATVAPVPGLLRRRDPAAWAAATLIGGLIAILGAVAFARAGFGLDGSTTSRYFEWGMLLPLLSAWAWSLHLGPGRLRGGILIGLWLLCALAFSNNWDFRVYETVAQRRREGLRCLQEAVRGGRDSCPMLYPFPLRDKLEAARRLGISFARGL